MITHNRILRAAAFLPILTLLLGTLPGGLAHADTLGMPFSFTFPSMTMPSAPSIPSAPVVSIPAPTFSIGNTVVANESASNNTTSTNGSYNQVTSAPIATEIHICNLLGEIATVTPSIFNPITTYTPLCPNGYTGGTGTTTNGGGTGTGGNGGGGDNGGGGTGTTTNPGGGTGTSTDSGGGSGGSTSTGGGSGGGSIFGGSTSGQYVGGGSSGGSVGTQGQVLGASAFNFTRDLYLTSRGDDVSELQQMLIDMGYNIPSGVTGYFWYQTKSALAAYQAANNIYPNMGYFGPITRAKFNMGIVPTTEQTTNQSAGSSIAAIEAQLATLKAQLAQLQTSGST